MATSKDREATCCGAGEGSVEPTFVLACDREIPETHLARGAAGGGSSTPDSVAARNRIRPSSAFADGTILAR